MAFPTCTRSTVAAFLVCVTAVAACSSVPSVTDPDPGPILYLAPPTVGCGREQPGSDVVDTVLDAEAKSYAIRLGRRTLETYLTDGEQAALSAEVEDAPVDPPPSPQLFVTLRGAGKFDGSFSSPQTTLAHTVRRSVVLAAQAGQIELMSASELADVRLELNALGPAEELQPDEAFDLATQIEPGRHALELSHAGGRAFFTERVMITHNFSVPEALVRLCVEAGLEDNCYTRSDVSLRRFMADHWVECGGDAGRFYRLFRGHRVVTLADVSRQAVEQTAFSLLTYLVQHQRAAGDFNYEYYPATGRFSQEDNTTRQAGAIYAMGRGATYFQDETLVQVARGAVENALTYEAGSPEGRGTFLEWDGRKLGATALALLGLAEFEATEDFREAAARLAEGVSAQQQADGRLESEFQGGGSASQQFAPGEALLALARATARWEEPEWLATVERAFDFYVRFWREQGEPGFVPWHSAAWLNMFVLTGDRRYAEFAFELLDGTLGAQQLGEIERDPLKADFAGAIHSGTTIPNVSTGTQLEPVPLAIVVARQLGDDERADRYLRVLRQGLRFCLQLAINDLDAFYMVDPSRALGGVRTTLRDSTVRIDGVQHTVTALLQSLIYTGDEPALWAD